MVKDIKKRGLRSNFNSGFTLFELIMVFIIIVLVAAISYTQIKSSLRQARLTKEREWVRAVVIAVESYHADTGQFPGSVFDLTGPTPPYLTASSASRCGRNVVDGGVQLINTCNLNILNFHYMIQYVEFDLSIPGMVVQYYELINKIPWDTGVCGTIPANTKYFYEMVGGKVTMSGCG